MTWDESRLRAVEQSAASCPDACSADVVSLIAEVRRLTAQNEQLCARADNLQNCLQHARVVLEHFSKTLPDPEHRRWAHGGLVGSEINPRGGNVPLELPERLRRREDA